MLFHGSSANALLAALLAAVRPTLLAALASHLRQGEYVSPIAGCEGIDCVKRYVALPDDNYAWHDTGVRIDGVDGASKLKWTGHVLNMTSQKWLTPANISHPLWWHILVVVVPEYVEFKDFASLSLDFGMNLPPAQLVRIDNRDTLDPISNAVQPCIVIDSSNLKERLPQLKLAVSKVAQVAASAHSIGVSLLNLPNSYEVFGTDEVHRRRSWDFLKAYAYHDFMRTGAKEPERLSELPIAKAMVRAMDTVSAFTAAHLPSGKVTRFGVMGYSKLGTIVWMAGAIDPRVKVIAPVAVGMTVAGRSSTPTEGASKMLDLFLPSRDYFEFKDKWLLFEAGKEYVPMFTYGGGPEYKRIQRILDAGPISSQLTLPKMYIMAANDFCFQDNNDDVKTYYPSMVGQKGFLQLPNTKHEASLPAALPTIAAFFRGVLLNRTMPEISYSFALGTVHAALASAHTPHTVTLWTADAGLSRDFKAATWHPRRLPLDGRNWFAPILKPLGAEYRGAFIEFKYAYPDARHTFATSTPIYVVPTAET